MTRLTKTELLNLKPCDKEARIATFGKANSMNAKEAFDAGFTISDLCWVAGKLKQNKKLVLFAKKCAESVSHFKNAPAAYAADAAARAHYAYTAYAQAANTAYAQAADLCTSCAHASNAREEKIKQMQQFFIEIFDSEE